eukprot:Plantae.Rhodophyta-Purpureofilum_apyrenoidigerum.ctg29337.p1 GENE.Plantae.Rhodophyta-Purpureofilum_apyrenoidigerum.ctg29337~~Plantae.Rhodophyta-Purpureofilum_apyrenoidigerum.ctg29337.p1  ORF type:complete len:611 (-),score=129.95 Plantae.Rhodophyta-Purpureofilum_apyrenoidigerum.ctg29337:221-2053(-)
MKLDLKEKYAGAPNGARGEATHIFSDPTGETDRISYPSGRSAVVRSVESPLETKIFLEHPTNVTSCNFAPKGLIASGDDGGTIRVWNPETMKQREELPLVGDAIRDICFTADMKFMAFATDARNCFAKVVKYPGCGSAGPVSGHTKRVTSVDIRNVPKPAVITGGDDMVSGFFEGPPVKDTYVPKIKRHHTNFVLDARFSPDGTKYATTSTDRTIYIIDAESHEELHIFKEHEGSVMGVAWNKDGTKIVTCSSDKTAKVWDISSGECVYTIKLGGTDFLDMLIGCTWIHKTNELVVASLRGEVHIFDEGADKPKKTLRGHSKPVTSLANLDNKVYTTDFSGLCVYTEIGAPATDLHFSGKGHKTGGKGIAVNSRAVISAENDGNVFITPIDTLEYPKKTLFVKGGCTNLVCPSADAPYAAIVINDSRVCILGYDESVTEALTFDRSETGTAVAVSDDGSKVAVSLELRGGAGKILMYNYNKGKLEKFGDPIQGPAAANRMIFTKDGQTLITGEKSRHVKMFDVEKQEKVSGGGTSHTARVDGLALSPDGKYVASVGMDGTLAVWVVKTRDDPVSVKAHRNGASGVGWVDNETIVTSGGDNVICTWTFSET